MPTQNKIEREFHGYDLPPDSRNLGVRKRKDMADTEMGPEQERWKRNKIDSGQECSAQKRKADDELPDLDFDEIARQNLQHAQLRHAAKEKEKVESRKMRRRVRERERRAKQKEEAKRKNTHMQRERRAKLSSEQKEEAKQKHIQGE